MPTRIGSVAADLLTEKSLEIETTAQQQNRDLFNKAKNPLLTQYLPSFYEMQFWSMYVDCALDKHNLQDLIKLALQQHYTLTCHAIKYQDSECDEYLSQVQRDAQIVHALVEVSYALYSYAITQNRLALLQVTTSCYEKLAILNVEYSMIQIVKYLITPLTKKQAISAHSYLN